EKALALLSIPKKGRGKAAALKEFGKHPTLDIEVSLFNGPYGPYLKAGKTNVGLPEGVTAENITAEKAFALMTEKLGDGKPKAAKKKTSKSKKTVKKAKSATEKAEVLGVKKVIVKKKK
ncbi:MAG: topoisomerase C-terminal repeat-containing protein, partial [Pseudobdellovibrio sp.]